MIGQGVHGGVRLARMVNPERIDVVGAWLGAAAIAGSASALHVAEAQASSMRLPATIRTEIVRLRLRHTWTTTMSSSEYRDTLQVRFGREGTTGVGEGAPIVRYHESAADAQKAVLAARELVFAGDPWRLETFLAQAFRALEGQYAARAALDIAVHDWIGRRLGIPVYRLLGLDPANAPITTFSIGIDTPEVTRQKVREAAEFPVLKVNVGYALQVEMFPGGSDPPDQPPPVHIDMNRVFAGS